MLPGRRRILRSAAGNVGALPDGALLLVFGRIRRARLSRRNPSSALAAATSRSAIRAKLNGRSRKLNSPRCAAPSPFRAAAGHGRLGAAPHRVSELTYPVTNLTWLYIPAESQDPDWGRAVDDYLNANSQPVAPRTADEARLARVRL